MSNYAVALVPPRYRHFIPVAPEFTVKVPGLKSSGRGGKLSQVMVYSTTQAVANNRFFPLSANFMGSDVAHLNLYINGVFQSNVYGFYGNTIPVLDHFGNPVIDPATGLPRTLPLSEFGSFTYNEDTNTVVLSHRIPIPAIGDIVRIETLIGDAIGQEHKFINMKPYLIQGLKPHDETLINDRDPGAQYFQGAYRCTMQVIIRPTHGILSISDDKMGFDYRPEVGYYGTDKFSYRLVNAMGQESIVACVTLDVGAPPDPA